MFSVQNYNSLADTQTGLPLAEIFFQATSTKGGAFGLVFMVWIALGPCVIGSQLSNVYHHIFDGFVLTQF
jgi:choline transport protein